MASYFPPTEDLPIFDNEVFDASNSDAQTLTIAKANLLYLRKTVTDTATALETFLVGVLSPSIEPLFPTSGLNIGNTQTSGTLNIANSQTSGTLNIANVASRTGAASVNISSGNGNASSMAIMNGSSTSGTLSIRTNTGNGPINIGTGLNTGLVTIGAGGCITNINSNTVNLTRNQSGTQPTFIECVTTTTTNQIDFHCNSLNSIDYDARILVSGGTTSAGNGTIELVALNTGIGLTSAGLVNIGNTNNTVSINSTALSLGTATKALQINTPIRVNYFPTSLTLPSQIGYVKIATLPAVNTVIPSGSTAIGSIELTAGSWILNFYVGTNVPTTLTINDGLGQRISINTTSGVLSTAYALVGSEGVETINANNVPTIGGVAFLQPLTTTTYYLNYTISFTVGVIKTSSVTHMNAMRIG